MASDLPLFANNIMPWYQLGMMHGVSRNRLDDTELLSVSIQVGIRSGFIVSNLLLLTLDDITVALVDNPTCGTYPVFDSHSRDVRGNPTPEGA